MNDNILNKPLCISCQIRDDVIPIIYGLVNNFYDTTDYVLGGCIVTENDAEWYCKNCEIEWGSTYFREKRFEFKSLKQYKKKGSFIFKNGDDLGLVCNAEKESSGLYIVYANKKKKYSLLYIGISGKLINDGSFKTRKGGMHDRLVNGKQFGKQRKFSWKDIILKDEIDELYIEWYDTFLYQRHIPKYVEGLLLQKYFEHYLALPPWNKEY